jgi:hypothetical protein
MRKILIMGIAALVTLIPTLAVASPTTRTEPAVPPGSGHTVVEVLGRKAVVLNHFADPNKGQATCSVQGESVDTNGNGLADALRGRAACLEQNKVIRIRLAFVKLQVFFAESWVDVAIDDVDKVSDASPAYAINYTPTTGFCVDDITLTYRVVQVWAIRWTDNYVSSGSLTSAQFSARAAANTQVC